MTQDLSQLSVKTGLQNLSGRMGNDTFPTHLWKHKFDLKTLHSGMQKHTIVYWMTHTQLLKDLKKTNCRLECKVKIETTEGWVP